MTLLYFFFAVKLKYLSKNKAKSFKTVSSDNANRISLDWLLVPLLCSGGSWLYYYIIITWPCILLYRNFFSPTYSIRAGALPSEQERSSFLLNRNFLIPDAIFPFKCSLYTYILCCAMEPHGAPPPRSSHWLMNMMALGVTTKQATLDHGVREREAKGAVWARAWRQEDRLKELDLCVRHMRGRQYWKGKVGTKYGRFTVGVRFSFIP